MCYVWKIINYDIFVGECHTIWLHIDISMNWYIIYCVNQMKYYLPFQIINFDDFVVYVCFVYFVNICFHNLLNKYTNKLIENYYLQRYRCMRIDKKISLNSNKACCCCLRRKKKFSYQNNLFTFSVLSYYLRINKITFITCVCVFNLVWISIWKYELSTCHRLL